MTLLILILLWVTCSVFSYRIAKDWWLRQYDFDTGDRTFFVVMSLTGPLNLVVTTFLWLSLWNETNRKVRVLEKRRK